MREDVQPIRQELAELLREYLSWKLPTTLAFPLGKSDRGTIMIRKDMAEPERHG